MLKSLTQSNFICSMCKGYHWISSIIILYLVYSLGSMTAFVSVKHWLKNLNYQLPDYYCINKPRKHLNKRARRGSGGVLLCIHKSLNVHVKLQESSNSEDRIWVKIQVPGAKVNLFCCFCSPNQLNSNFQ